MPLTISNSTGDGVSSPLIRSNIELPDSGTTINIGGAVDQVGVPTVAITPATLTAPAPPGSGSIYWLIEINTTTGAATVVQSTVSMPSADPGTIAIFQQTLASGQADPALVPTDVTPNTY